MNLSSITASESPLLLGTNVLWDLKAATRLPPYLINQGPRHLEAIEKPLQVTLRMDQSSPHLLYDGRQADRASHGTSYKVGCGEECYELR